MCGIFGFSNSTPLTRLMTPTLALAMEQRGDQSWGVTDGDFIYKTAGSISDTFIDCDLDGPVYHTRMASCGAVSDRNAHPFQYKDKLLVTGVHNGTLSNHLALKNKYNREAVEVDSEHIFMHLAEGKSVGEIGGSGAVVWYESPPEKLKARIRYFSRFNSESMHFAKMKSGEIVFASTKAAIQIAAQLASAEIDFFYDTEEKMRYWIEPDTKSKGHYKLWNDDKMPWAANPVWTTYNQTVSSHGGWQGGVRNIGKDECPGKLCNGAKLQDEQVICGTCFKALQDDIFTATAGA